MAQVVGEGGLLPNEVIDESGDVLDAQKAKKKKEDLEKVDRVREDIANVYTFVRSQEINRVIGAFTFDHYVDEAKRRIKGTGREIRDAAGVVIQDDKTKTQMMRPSLLDYLNKLEQRFNASYQEALKMAQNAEDQAKAK